MRHIDSLTASPTPCNPCLPSVSSCPEQKTRPCSRKPCLPRFPRFLHADEVTSKFPRLHQHTLGMPIPVLPLYSQGVHIVGRYNHKCLLLSRSGLACCNPCQPTRGPTPPSFLSFFPVFSHLSRYRLSVSQPGTCLVLTAGLSRPSPPHPRHSRPRCRGVCLPTLCPASPLATLYP